MKKQFKIRDNSIVKCKTQAPEIDIPLKQKITEIAEKTFRGNKYVEKVNILGNIRIINNRAF